jgi:dTDP-glucose pyrophosphorylase
MENLTFNLRTVASIFDIIKILDNGGIGIALAVDDEKKLVGIVTDGDIRRAILNSIHDIKDVVNYYPITMHHKTRRRDVVSKLRALHRRHMPLIDDHGVLVEIFSLDDIEFVSKDSTIVIMAGGLGSRLGELTKDTPKPMLKVGDRPMLRHLIDMFSSYGFRSFIFCVNYKKDVIKNYFAEGSELGVKIKYVEEHDKLGTAGALSLIPSEYLSEDFIVINADVLTTLDFSDVVNHHCKASAVGTMCVRRYSHQIPFGVVVTKDDNSIMSIEEKPMINFDVNAGIYVLNKKALSYLKYSEYLDMPNLFQMLVDDGLNTNVFQVEDYWLDIGRVDDLNKANHDMGSILGISGLVTK